MMANPLSRLLCLLKVEGGGCLLGPAAGVGLLILGAILLLLLLLLSELLLSWCMSPTPSSVADEDESDPPSSSRRRCRAFPDLKGKQAHLFVFLQKIHFPFTF